MQKLPFNSYLCGILAGTLGIGGGLIINPYLLKEDVPVEISAAITSCVVFFTSLSTSTQYSIAGAFRFQEAFLLMVFAGMGSWLGNIFLKK